MNESFAFSGVNYWYSSLHILTSLSLYKNTLNGLVFVTKIYILTSNFLPFNNNGLFIYS